MPVAADPMVERLLSERGETVAKIERIKTSALDRKRDLTNEELEDIKEYSTRIKTLDTHLETVTENAALSESVQARIAMASPGTNVAGHQYRSAGELLWDVIHNREREAGARLEAVQRRAAQHMGTTAVETTAVAGGFGGLIASPITGPVIDLAPKGRPWLSLIGVRPAPSSMTFMRPRIVDPNFDTGVAEQALQKAELASQKFDVVADPLQLNTLGGYLNLSRQAEAFIPSALDIVVNQLLKRLAAKTENALAVEVAKTASHVALAADADAAAVRQAIFDASALVFDQTGSLPEWIAMGPLGWARLGGLVDLAQRPLFPFGTAVNANGQTSPGTFTVAGLGLTAVVTPGITTGDYFVGNELGIEAYEYVYPTLEAIEPSLLGRQVAVASSLVLYRPTTKESPDGGVTPAQGNGVVRIGV
jgi:HK97 family phage major capsid protein